MMANNSNSNNNNNTMDTKMTKIFVGGLAWETQRETMRRYFEQFGEIVEAVVITDKNTGRSKGYGFVTFKESEAAMRACQNMNPVIDGRRANCNLACLGASKPRPPTSPRHGTGRFRSPGLVGSSPHHHQFRGSLSSSSSSSSSSGFIHQQQQFSFPYSGYGFSGYSQEGMYPMSYYNHHLYGGGQQYAPYTGHQSTGMFHGYYPYYPHQYNVGSQSSNPQAQVQVQAHHHQGFSFQYTTPPPLAPIAAPVIQYPYLPPHHQQHFTSSQPPPPPILSLPTSLALSLASSSTSSLSSASISAATTATKTVVITTTTTTNANANANVVAEEEASTKASSKDGNEEAIKSSIKIED